MKCDGHFLSLRNDKKVTLLVKIKVGKQQVDYCFFNEQRDSQYYIELQKLYKQMCYRLRIDFKNVQSAVPVANIKKYNVHTNKAIQFNSGLTNSFIWSI